MSIEALSRRLVTLERSPSASREIVKEVLEAIADELAEAGSVRLPGLGTLSVKERAASEGRNPRTGEKIQIAASRSVGFKIGKSLRERLNGGQGEAEEQRA